MEITSPFGITIFYFTKNAYAPIVKSFYLKKTDFVRKLGHLKKNLRNTRYVTYTIIPVCKAGIFLLGMLSILWLNEGSFTVAFEKFDSAFQTHKIIVEEVCINNFK